MPSIRHLIGSKRPKDSEGSRPVELSAKSKQIANSIARVSDTTLATHWRHGAFDWWRMSSELGVGSRTSFVVAWRGMVGRSLESVGPEAEMLQLRYNYVAPDYQRSVGFEIIWDVGGFKKPFMQGFTV